MIDKGDLYSCVCSSIIRFIEDFREANNPTATYFDWDAHADISELPAGDVSGPAGIGMVDEEGQIQQVVFGYGIATTDDQNLFRLRSLMSKLRGLVVPGSRIPIYDTNGEVASWMVTKTPLTIAPVSKAEIRSIQFISVMALIDPHATSSLG